MLIKNKQKAFVDISEYMGFQPFQEVLKYVSFTYLHCSLAFSPLLFAIKIFK